MRKIWRLVSVLCLALLCSGALLFTSVPPGEAKCEQTQDPFYVTYWADGCYGPAHNCAVFDYDCEP